MSKKAKGRIQVDLDKAVLFKKVWDMGIPPTCIFGSVSLLEVVVTPEVKALGTLIPLAIESRKTKLAESNAPTTRCILEGGVNATTRID